MMTPNVKSSLNPCPFCGVVTDVPHETQEGCIEALHKEIARIKEILEFVRDPRTDPPPRDADTNGH